MFNKFYIKDAFTYKNYKKLKTRIFYQAIKIIALNKTTALLQDM